MSNQKKEYKTVILNGTRVWLSVLGFVVIHFGAGVWWASGVSHNIETIKEHVVEIKRDLTKQDGEIRKNTLSLGRLEYGAHNNNNSRDKDK